MHDAVSRPPTRDVGLIVIALTAVATSGPLMAACAAPALAIAFWRNALATAVILPFGFRRLRRELRLLGRREWTLALAAGALLALHFGTWVPSLSYTTVASATALVATQPIWSALLAHLQGQRVRPRVWLGVGLAVLGAALLSGVDISVDGEALLGDGLAIVGGLFAAAYMAVGGEVRRTVSTTSYTAICYSTCAVLMVVVCLVGGQDLGGYDGTTWVQLLAITGGAQLLGHSLFNVVLKTTSHTVVSLCILLEVPGAALIAAVFLDEIPPLAALPAALVLLAGIATVISAAPREPASVPAE